MNRSRWLFCSIVIFLTFAYSLCQENAGETVAKELKKCYNTTELNSRERRLPATINVLIELIRQIEDGKSTQDARSFAIELVHRFRQDGIEFAISKNPEALPYSVYAYQVGKNRILLQKFIPGSAINFPNETLNSIEQCSMHFMLSNTIEHQKRYDEGEVCNKLSKYTMRPKREVNGKFQNRFRRDVKEDDVEIITPAKNAVPSNANSFPSPRSTPLVYSECPVESGVVYTKWGPIQAGTVIGAIAAAFEDQQIIVDNKYKVNSIYASTISGDLAEMAFWEGGLDNIYTTGYSGGWNSTTVPKWYFLSNRKEIFFTDPEIRANLDGLIIAKKVGDWRNKFQTLKLSQILDMYYSNRGVFSENIKACRRNELSTQFMTKDELTEQSYGYGLIYSKNARTKVSLNDNVVPSTMDKAIDSFLNNYLKLNDPKCSNEPSRRISTDIFVVVDTNFPYRTVQSALSFLLDNIDVNKFETNYTIINGLDGSIMVNSSWSILQFHQLYNETVHKQQGLGMDLTRSFPVVERLLEDNFRRERDTKKTSGRSTIVLIVPFDKSVAANQGSLVQSRISTLANYLPDVKFMVLGSGSKDAYYTLASNSDDVFTLPETTQDSLIIQSVQSLIERIANVPRRIGNPRCGSEMSGDLSTDNVALYVEPGLVNYYRIAPNYFYGEGNRAVKIRSQDGITVCVSRSITLPSQNISGSDCKPVRSEETFDLTDTCTDSLSSCNPLYISVEGMNHTNLRCSDPGCRFPDSIKFEMTTENFVCTSEGLRIISSTLFLVLTSFFLYVINNV